MQIRRRSPNPAIAVETLRYQTTVPDAAPKHILEEIIWHKEVEVEQMRERMPLSDLQQQAITAPPIRNFVQALRSAATQPALIAEVKKASPSKGVIRADFDPLSIAQAYQRGGAACISVLTDKKFFQGSFDYLRQIRATVDLPLLCKDFVIYPYQIYLARVYGADAVLLIAAVLSNQDLQYFVKIVNAIGMTALVEVHTLAELDRVLALQGVMLIGINNRNLEDFSVDLRTTAELLQSRQTTARGILVVSESGLYNSADVEQVRQAGAAAILVGESLLKQDDLQAAIGALFRSPS